VQPTQIKQALQVPAHSAPRITAEPVVQVQETFGDLVVPVVPQQSSR
jgi:hypothetical protein